MLGSSVSKIDELETVSQDAAQERQNLEAKQAKKRTLQEALADKKAEVDSSIQKARELQTEVKGELATLVAQEQARRAQQAAPAHGPVPVRAPPAAEAARAVAADRSRAGAPRPRRARVPAPTSPPRHPERVVRSPRR